MKQGLSLYVGVNESWRGDTGDYFTVSSDCFEADEELRFTTRDAADAVTSAISRAYYRGKADAKRELFNWIKD